MKRSIFGGVERVEARSRPWRRALIVVGAILILAAVAASVTSKLLWGYWLREPKTHPRLRQIDRIDARSVVGIFYGDDGRIEVQTSLNHDSRPDEPIDATELAAMAGTFERELRGEIRAAVSHVLGGAAIQYTTKDGERLTGMWLGSGPITDESSLECELLLSRPAEGAPRILWTRWFYDVQGLPRRLNWVMIFMVYVGVLGMIALVVVAGLLVWSRLRRRHGATRGFEVMVNE